MDANAHTNEAASPTNHNDTNIFVYTNMQQINSSRVTRKYRVASLGLLSRVAVSQVYLDAMVTVVRRYTGGWTWSHCCMLMDGLDGSRLSESS
jgi:hypothetical protein